MSDEATIVLDLPRVEVAPEVTVLAGRYELLECIGVGGMGEVHLALDTLTGAQVAVKRMPAMTTQAEARVRRELAALRFLQVPGVVRLRDDGWDEHGRFLVMEHLRGDKLFERDLTWEEARRPFLELLDTLARVHALGIVHRDLKPGNVLLVDGHPVVLDFGISLGPALADRGTSDRSWTPGYASLQQRSGAPADVRDDLYAVGCMLDAVVDPPPEVAQLRRRLMADDPDLRPASAEEALLALGGLPLARRLEPVLARLQGPVNEIALRALFAGPSAFLHVPEDAARLLWARAGSDFGAVAHELESWLRRGLATLEGDQVRLRREALERLQLTMDVELEDLYVVAPARAAALADEGRLSGAQAWCELGLVGARERGDEIGRAHV